MAQYGFGEYHFYVREPVAPLLDTAQAPASAGQSADIVNNLSHLADEIGQVWAADGLRNARFRDTDASFTGASSEVPLHMRRVLVWSMRTRPVGIGGSDIATSSLGDGGAYRLRVKVGASCSSTAGSPTCTFYIIAGVAGDPVFGPTALQAAAAAAGVTLGSNATTGSTTSATEAWLTLGSNVLTIDAAMVNSLRTTVSGYDGAGNAVDVDIYQLAVDVFGFTGTNGIKPRLHGMYVAEYVG